MATETTHELSFTDLLSTINARSNRSLSSFLRGAHKRCTEARIPDISRETPGSASDKLLLRLEDDGGPQFSTLYWELYEEAATLLGTLQQNAPRSHEPRAPRQSQAASAIVRQRTLHDVEKSMGFVRGVTKKLDDSALKRIVPHFVTRLEKIGLTLPDPNAPTVLLRLTALMELIEGEGDWDKGWSAVRALADTLEDFDVVDEDRRAAMMARWRSEDELAAAAARAEAQQARAASVATVRERAQAAARATAAAVAKPRDPNRGSASGGSKVGLVPCPSCGSAVLPAAKFCPECGHSMATVPAAHEPPEPEVEEDGDDTGADALDPAEAAAVDLDDKGFPVDPATKRPIRGTKRNCGRVEKATAYAKRLARFEAAQAAQ